MAVRLWAQLSFLRAQTGWNNRRSSAHTGANRSVGRRGNLSVHDALEKARIDAHMVDSHFHSIEMAEKGLDPAVLLEWCFSGGLAAAIDVSVKPEDLSERRDRTARFTGISYAAGYYPSESGRFGSSGSEAAIMLSTLDAALADERVVAVGEIGLDGYREYAPIAAQQELFRAQLSAANAHGLPVVIHNRGTDEEIVDSVKSARLSQAGVMHCFSSDYQIAKRFMDLGFLISFAGNLTFKNASTIQEVARRIPLDALLVETDSPYLAPMPVRGNPNHPGYIGHTYAFLAAIRNEDPAELALQIERNFSRLFGIRASG